MRATIQDNLDRARRNLDFAEVQDVGGWKWDEKNQEWCLEFSIVIETEKLLPSKTHWIASVGQDYPDGIIEIYPAAANGIRDTYPHQANNGWNAVTAKNSLHRPGALCLLSGTSKEAIPNNADFKLRYYIWKAIKWVAAANDGSLQEEGDPFEFPMFKYSVSIDPRLRLVLFKEDMVSADIWRMNSSGSTGMMGVSQFGDGIAVIRSFYDSAENLLYEPSWGKKVKSSDDTQIGFWIRVKSIPHVNKWQAPNTYSELREWLASDGIDFEGWLRKVSPKIRDGKRHLIAFGAMAPDYVGDKPKHLTWFLLLLPKLNYSNAFERGRHAKESALFRLDKGQHFRDEIQLTWVVGQNCAPGQLHSRGMINSGVRNSKVLIIGAGSLGSAVADMLARGGLCNIDISDDDSFVPGNITRHVLSINSSESSKAKSLAKHLNEISPNVDAGSTSALTHDNYAILNNYDLVIDCSASSLVLELLDESNSTGNIVVASFGFAAENVYFCLDNIASFSAATFREKFSPYIEKDSVKINYANLPLEGTGCWSPVFPAKDSDVKRAASLVVDTLLATYGVGKSCSIVFTIKRDSNGIIDSIEKNLI